MRIVSAARLCLRRCALALLFVAAASWTPAAADTDIVLLVDVSTSMRDMFPEVKTRLHDEVDRTSIGDRISLVTFGERAHLLDRRSIESNQDRAALHTIIDGIAPAQRNTYLLQGVDRAFTELRYLFEGRPGRDRRLVWLSDEKNNPPSTLGNNVLTLDDLRDAHEDVSGEGEWFEMETPFSTGGDNESRDFLAWARLSHHLLRVREAAVDLGEQSWPNTRMTAHVRLHPPGDKLEGLPLAVSVRVRNPANPDGDPLTLASDPTEIAIRNRPWTQQFDIAYDGPEGLVEGYLVFESLDDAYEVDPPRIPFSFTAGRSAHVGPVVGWEELPRLSSSEVRLWRFGGDDTPAREPVIFGPVEPGNTYTKRIRVTTTELTTPDQLTVSSNMELPPGFVLSAAVAGQGKEFAIDLRLDLTSEPLLPDFALLGQGIDGSILVRTPDPDIGVRPAIRPVRIAVGQERIRWGRPKLALVDEDEPPAQRAPKQDAPALAAAPPAPAVDVTTEPVTEAQTAEAAQQLAMAAQPVPAPAQQKPRAPKPAPTKDDVAEHLSTESSASGKGLRALVPPIWAVATFGMLAGGVAAAWLWTKRPRKTTLRAELRAVRLPDDVRRVEMLDLGRMLGGRAGAALTIGADKGSDIVLAHESIQPRHARLSTVSTHESVNVLLEALPGAEVRVNDELRSGRVRLRQNDVITIGDCIFLFTTAEPETHAVVHYLDGRIIHGVPETWDLLGESIPLLLDNPETEVDRTTIWFRQLKGLFIAIEGGTHHAPDPSDSRFVPGMQITVVFADGEVLTGYVLKEYSSLDDRFYLFPREASSTICVLVERGNARAVHERTM